MLSTLPCPDAGVRAVPGNQALAALREFRERLHGCLAARADALFELADAVLCSDRPVSSLVQLSLEPEFRRGHGALYDALAAGRIDEERLFSLLTQVLPPLVDGPETREWIADHDVIDHQATGRALAGVPAADAARVRDSCARWQRVRVAIDATAYPRPDAECSAGREHVHNNACHCKGASKTAPGWEYQAAAVTGHLRTAWAGIIDIRRTTPSSRTAATIAQVKDVTRRLRAAGHCRAGAPLFLFDAGYSAAALTDGLAGQPAHILVRLPAGAVLYQDAPSWPGRWGRPAHRGPEIHCLSAEEVQAAAEGHGRRGRKKPLPQAPEPDEGLVIPDTALYGTVTIEAWHDVHPQVHGDRGWFAGRGKLPVLRGTLIHVAPERLPYGHDPRKAMWLWHAGPGPLSLDELWRAYVGRFDVEHAFRTLKGSLGLTAAKVRTPAQAGRWAQPAVAAHAQLLLARPLASGLRRPWEKPPAPGRPLTPGRVRRDFRNIRTRAGTPARVPKTARPGPGRPKGTATGPAPRHPVAGQTAKRDKPPTTHDQARG